MQLGSHSGPLHLRSLFPRHGHAAPSVESGQVSNRADNHRFVTGGLPGRERDFDRELTSISSFPMQEQAVSHWPGTGLERVLRP